MSVLDMDIREHIADIVNAFASVFGEDKKATIGAKINSGYYVAYNDIEGIKAYIRFLEDCKARELYIKFLNKIGIQTKYDEQENFAEGLDDETSHLIGKYIDKLAFVERDLHPLYGIQPFFMEYEDDLEEKTARGNKVNFINWFLGEESGYLTEDDLDEFYETEKYQKFLKRLEPYKKAYDEIDAEYCSYLEKIEAEYQPYIDREIKRRKDFLKKLNKENELELTEEEIIEYTAKSIEYQKYFNERFFGDNYKKIICLCMNEKKTLTLPVCFERGGATVYLAVVLYGARQGLEGYLDNTCLHEICHIIGKEKCQFGFDKSGADGEKIELNPYNKHCRKYERLNENFTDIITAEALEYLRKNDIYMMEDKNHTRTDTEDINTADITKKMLMPIFEKYREDILQVMLSGEPEPFVRKIGRDNFEELNDTINNVDNLCYKGLQEKLDKDESDNALVIKYKEQLQRLKKVYQNIDRKAAKNIENNSKNKKTETRDEEER